LKIQNNEFTLKSIKFTNLKLYVKCWQYDIHKTHWANLSPVPVFYDSDSFLRVVTSVKESTISLLMLPVFKDKAVVVAVMPVVAVSPLAIV
jgi:hypothetical protein